MKNFDDVFGDFFDNVKPMTDEERKLEKERLEKEKTRCEEFNTLFQEYGKSLPGGENVSDQNPVVRINWEMEDGKLVERAVTKNDLFDEFFSSLFNDNSDDFKHKM